MILEHIIINRVFAGTGAAVEQYKGVIKFKGSYGSVEIQLTDELSKRVLAVIGENAVEATRELAQKLSGEVFTALPSAQTTVTRELPEATVVVATNP